MGFRATKLNPKPIEGFFFQFGAPGLGWCPKRISKEFLGLRRASRPYAGLLLSYYIYPYRGYSGIMENGNYCRILGLYGDNGKENGNYYDGNLT